MDELNLFLKTVWCGWNCETRKCERGEDALLLYILLLAEEWTNCVHIAFVRKSATDWIFGMGCGHSNCFTPWISEHRPITRKKEKLSTIFLHDKSGCYFCVFYFSIFLSFSWLISSVEKELYKNRHRLITANSKAFFLNWETFDILLWCRLKLAI